MEIVGESSRYALQEHLHLIAAPLQVIWGKQDQVESDVPLLNVSCAPAGPPTAQILSQTICGDDDELNNKTPHRLIIKAKLQFAAALLLFYMMIM